MYKQCAFTRLKECKYDIWTDNNKSFYFLMKCLVFVTPGLAPRDWNSIYNQLNENVLSSPSLNSIIGVHPMADCLDGLGDLKCVY